MTTQPDTVHASADAGLDTYPFGRKKCPFSLAEEYREYSDTDLRQVDFNGTPATLVTGYANVRSVLGDPRMSVRGIDDASRGDAGDQAVPGFFVAMDPPEHDDLRRVLAREFTPRRMAAMRDNVTRIANELIDEMLTSDGPVDLVESLALPLPSLVICELLGVPYDKHDFFQEQTRAVLASGSTPDDIAAAIGAVMGYLGELVTIKMSTPGDDLLSMLVKHIESGAVSVPDVVGMASLLLMAGHETTANMIGLGIFSLLEHPDQLTALREDPSLMSQAIEELLRHLDIISNLPRVATEDIEIEGQTIPAGSLVMVSTEAGNRDPEVFDDPDAFDIHRDASRHLTFGHGIHTCLGAPLARLELDVVFTTLLERIPTLRLAVPAEEVQIKGDARIRGAYAVPITWDRA